jgi:hypothetical protein
MAWRLNQMVVRGVLDNREKGKVTGALWLTGHESPVRLELEGNCEDDLAGCLVEFNNRTPRPDPSIGKFCDQVGTVGNITASRKVRAIPPDVRVEELTREFVERAGWSNSLYLEWFSDINGRVVVELLDPEIRISEPVWAFTTDEKAEQQKPSEISGGFIHMFRVDDGGGEIRQLNEFHYEQALKQFDDYVLRFEELWERYKDDPDCNQKIADELECTWIDDDDEEDEYADGEFPDTPADQSETAQYPDPLWHGYPLIVRAKDLCVAVSQFGKSEKCSRPGSSRLDELQTMLVQAMTKLADALPGIVSGNEEREPALVVALLKRSLSQYHLAMEVLDRLSHAETVGDVVPAWRAELLGIRQEILDEMSRLRRSDAGDLSGE